MGLYDEFRFRPASWLPHSELPLEELERVRNIRREDMEYTNENGYSVRVVLDPTLCMVQDMFYRIVKSDLEDKPFSMICPNQWPAAYSAVAEMINKFNINCRNLHAFAMDEWADENGNVAPLTYGAGLGYSFLNHFYYRIREDLRPARDHWHTFTNELRANDAYSNVIDEVTGGGVDVIYTATGWPGHTAFIDPRSEEFKAASMEEFLQLGSRITTEVPLTVCENSLFRTGPVAARVRRRVGRAAEVCDDRSARRDAREGGRGAAQFRQCGRQFVAAHGLPARAVWPDQHGVPGIHLPSQEGRVLRVRSHRQALRQLV